MFDLTGTDDLAMAFLLSGVLGYLLGSIPFGLVLTRLAGLGDIRKTGSGNIGATNVLRTGKKSLAAATLVLDGLKGAVAVLIAAAVLPTLAVPAGAAAFLGHLYPVWLKFRGGKGVATFLGVMLAAAWPVGLACCGIWLATAFVFRISSLAALVATAASPILAYYLAPTEVVLLAAAMTFAIYMRHGANLERLLRGEEPRIGDNSEKKSA